MLRAGKVDTCRAFDHRQQAQAASTMNAVSVIQEFGSHKQGLFKAQVAGLLSLIWAAKVVVHGSKMVSMCTRSGCISLPTTPLLANITLHRLTSTCTGRLCRRRSLN